MKFFAIQKYLSHIIPKSPRFEKSILPLGQLFLLDRISFQLWVRNIYVIDALLGTLCRQRMGLLFVKLARLDPVLSRSLIVVLPDRMIKLPPASHITYLNILDFICDENPLAIDLFSDVIPHLMLRFSQEKLISFLSEGLEIFAKNPQGAEAFLRMQSSQSLQREKDIQESTQLEDVRRILTLYARGHCGEDVRIYPCKGKAYTDGQNIYLPENLHLGQEQNLLAYRILTARCAGYLEFGTLDLHIESLSRKPQGGWRERRENEVALERFFRSFPNHVLAKDLFFMLENYRIECRVQQEYPGVTLDMASLGTSWRPKRPEPVGLSDVEMLMEALYQQLFLHQNISLPNYQKQLIQQIVDDFFGCSITDMTVDHIAEIVIQYFSDIYDLLQKSPIKNTGLDVHESTSQEQNQKQYHSQNDKNDVFDGDISTPEYRPFVSDTTEGILELDAMDTDMRKVEHHASLLREKLESEGQNISMQEARKRIRMSYVEMADFLDRNQGPAGGFQEQVSQETKEHRNSNMRHPLLMEHCDPLPLSFSYPEWDSLIDDCKPNWCHIKEFVVHEGDSAFAEQMLQEYGAEIQHVRRSFEALRPQDMQIFRGLEDGDDLDFDRVLEMIVDRKTTGDSTHHIYQHRKRQHRDTAVSFLLDMSSSTNELANSDGKRILDVEKEALFVISEALDALGDDFSIYGFSGYGRDQAAFYIAKDFDDAWNTQTRNRVGNISWKMENRDGVAIRHCVQKLKKRSNRSKILILLSDGKPLDCGCDQYSGRYAQGDVKKALQEARQAGVRSFCITVDPYGQDYLEEIYGKFGYLVITQLTDLPYLLPKMYWRLTRS